MCLEYYPECGDGGDGCCERSLRRALVYAKRKAKRVTSPEFTVVESTSSCTLSGRQRWHSDFKFIDACCPVCAKADFIAQHFFDKGIGCTFSSSSSFGRRTS